MHRSPDTGKKIKEFENMSIIRDASLWESGKHKIDWVKSCMPVLSSIEERFVREKPLKGLRISMSIDVYKRQHIGCLPEVRPPIEQ